MLSGVGNFVVDYHIWITLRHYINDHAITFDKGG